MNRQQQQVIGCPREESRILRDALGLKRIIVKAAQDRCLATAAMKLGKDLLRQCGTLFSPETILRWHRCFVARKYDGSGTRGPGPKKANSVRKLVLEMAEQNPSWGYMRSWGMRADGWSIWISSTTDTSPIAAREVCHDRDIRFGRRSSRPRGLAAGFASGARPATAPGSVDPA